MNKALPLLVSVAFGACTGDVTDQPGAAVRDSAGIRIVENTTPLWQEAEAWRLSPEPVVDVGGGDRQEQQLFRVAGALRLEDGRIAIADGGSMELRFYDSNGGHEKSVGGQGDGPGEFQGLSALSRYLGDTIVVFDFRLRRVSFFESDGRFGYSWRVEPPTKTTRSPTLVGVTHDGSLYMRFARSRGSPNPGQPVRRTVVIFRYSGQGDVIDSIGAFPGWEWMTFKLRSGGSIQGPLLFGRNTFIHATAERLYVASSDSYQVDLYADGVWDTSIRWPLELKNLLPNHIDDQRTETLSRAGPGPVRQIVEEQYELTPFPETWPAFSALVADQLGNAWTARSGPSSQSTTWDVFDPTGRWLGPVRMPTALRITDIGPDYVLGVWRDADDVEHVQLYDLIKPER